MFRQSMIRLLSSAVAAPTLASLNYSLGDIAGGGVSIIATGTNCATVTAVNIWGGTVAPSATTSTTVTFTLPAHAAGTTTVSLTGPGGTSATLAFESWSPAQITGIDAYLDANKGVTGGAAVSAWLDQSSNARNFVQASAPNKPAQTASQFGTLPSVRFAKEQWVALAAEIATAAGASKFAVAKWTSTDAVAAGNDLVPLCMIGSTLGGWGGFGASAGALQAATYPLAAASRGSGLNDGNPRLVGVTYDAVTNMKFYLGTTQQGATSTTAAMDSRNAYDAIGNGAGSLDGFAGDLGAVIVVAGVISGGDMTKLNTWAQQRFGTP